MLSWSDYFTVADTLNGIQETVLIYQGDRGRPRARRMITETSPEQDALSRLFGFETYAPPADIGTTPHQPENAL